MVLWERLMTNEVMAGLGEVGAMDRSDEALGLLPKQGLMGP